MDNVTEPLNNLRVLLYMKEVFILERNLINVVDVPLISSGVLANMREVILERNGTNVEIVAETLTCAQILFNIGEFMLERNR